MKRGWHPPAHVCESLRPNLGTKQRVGAVESIDLDVSTGGSSIHVMSELVGNSVAPVLLGTSFMHKFIKGTYTTETKIVSFRSQLIAFSTLYEV